MTLGYVRNSKTRNSAEFSPIFFKTIAEHALLFKGVGKVFFVDRLPGPFQPSTAFFSSPSICMDRKPPTWRPFPWPFGQGIMRPYLFGSMSHFSFSLFLAQL